MILFLTSKILLPNSTNFSGKSLFSLDICHIYSIYINAKNTKFLGCKYAEDIKSPNKLFSVFLSILIRL